MEGLHELPTRVFFPTCPTSWEQGRGSGRGRGTSFPLPCPPVPLGPPENVSAMRNGSQALVRWQEPRLPLQGTLLGYRLAYRGQDTPEVGAAGWVRVEWLWEAGDGGRDDKVETGSYGNRVLVPCPLRRIPEILNGFTKKGLRNVCEHCKSISLGLGIVTFIAS